MLSDFSRRLAFIRNLAVVINRQILLRESQYVHTYTAVSIRLNTQLSASPLLHAHNHNEHLNLALLCHTILSQSTLFKFQPVWFLRRFIHFPLNTLHTFMVEKTN